MRLLALLCAVSAPAFGLHESASAQDEQRDAFMAYVRSRGYSVEVHDVNTDDHVRLTMFRIPNPGKPAAFLQHGILDSSYGFVYNTNFNPLAFEMHDAGYDVFLGNSRGNAFNTMWADGTDASDSDEFWDFSYETMGMYDLPAQIEAAAQISGREKVNFVGHSQGTSQFLVAASRAGGESAATRAVQKALSRVPVAVLLSPVSYLGHDGSKLLKVMTWTHVQNSWLVRKLFAHGFLVSGGWRWAADAFCTITLHFLCSITVSTVVGSSKYDDSADITRYTNVFPFGTSLKDMQHYAQGLNGKNFASYDYGKEGNEAHYDQPTAPAYDMSRVHVPIALFVATDDDFTTPEDVDHLQRELPHVVQRKDFEGFSHATWMVGNAKAGYFPDEVVRTVATFGEKGQPEPHARPQHLMQRLAALFV